MYGQFYSENNFIRQLVLGVRELHNSGIAHLNLSPHMIFLAAGGMIKIANFAHAREVAKGSSVECDIAKMQFTEMLAPEQTSKGTNGLYSDVYSLAKIIAFIKYGKIEEVETLVAEKAKTKDPLAELLQSMMQKEPSKRPDMDSVRQAINSAVTKKGSFSPSCA
jgi:serine/threonine protein kinase